MSKSPHSFTKQRNSYARSAADNTAKLQAWCSGNSSASSVVQVGEGKRNTGMIYTDSNDIGRISSQTMIAFCYQLNFIGVTVEPNRRYIHFPGDKHMFTPVPVGGPTPPKQVCSRYFNQQWSCGKIFWFSEFITCKLFKLYEIYNGGSMAVMYEVNVAPLVELQSANYNYPILTCLNPQGEVLPGTCANIEFIFAPLEAKTYSVSTTVTLVYILYISW